MMSALHTLFERHRATIESALEAIHSRTFHAHWPEVPSGKIYGDNAQADGEAAFTALLHTRFERCRQDDAEAWHGGEVSPYGFPLGITYPVFSPQVQVDRARRALPAWARLDPAERAGVLTEALERSAGNFFAIAYATMHTTGQGFVMAFQASGPHAHDRALEAIALGYHEQTRFPREARWDKPVGRTTVSLRKTYRAVGRGVGLVIACSTFPVWNSFPGLFASLVTGNPVIVKPHPGAVLPLAMAVADIRATLRDNGVDPDVIQLAVDGEDLVAKKFAEHPDVRLIDYTGGSAFGEYLESLPGKTVFTEKAGINSVIIDSTDNLDAMLENLAFSLSLYSGQMCTTPQDIFIPQSGIMADGVHVSFEDVVTRLAGAIDAIVANEKVGPGTLGAIQNEATLSRLDSARLLGCPVVRDTSPVQQPGFTRARSWSPAVLEVPPDRADLLHKEMFGPVAFVIPTDSTEHSLALAAAAARTAGAITFAAYCTDPLLMDRIEEEMSFAGASISFNLTGPIWVNQSATFSDFHVTGGNPAGNASLVDPAFVVRRFFIAGSRRPAA